MALVFTPRQRIESMGYMADLLAQKRAIKQPGEIALNMKPGEVRKVLERANKTAFIRMWMTPGEYEQVKDKTPGMTCTRLSDGNYAIWRPLHMLIALHAGTKDERDLAVFIESRVINDEII
jgi:hypothetical protein